MTDAIKPPIGTYSTCRMCGEEIRFVGPYWDHCSYVKPRHPALPSVGTIKVDPLDVGAPPDEHIDPEWSPSAKQLRGELAAYAHEAWAGWMRYLFGKCYEAKDGGLVIPAWAVARWTRQMNQDYKDLPIGENESDIAEAEKMMAILFKYGWKVSED